MANTRWLRGRAQARALLLVVSAAFGGCSSTDDAQPAGQRVSELTNRCRTSVDCPAPGAPCVQCSDGTTACPEVSCVNRRCVYDFPECPSYQACAGKSCGDSCTICDPADPNCVESAELKYCQADNTCSGLQPECPVLDPCAAVRCAAGTHCVDGACVPDQKRVFCGGIAGIPCPGAGQCIDDPSDDCDPNAGGADCGGICVCTALGLCVSGYHWDSSPEVCGCVPDRPRKGAKCGSRTCGEGQYCCNASCGICAPLGGVCIQVACEPTL